VELKDGGGQTTGWLYFNERSEIETYNAVGTLVSIQNPVGLVQTLSYDAKGHLTSISDSFGRLLSFAYDSQDRISTLSDPTGGQYTYSYDSFHSLVSVTYPDGKQRSYTYNGFGNSGVKNQLISIVDENGTQFASYSYDMYGTAIASQHAGGADAVAVSYSSTGYDITSQTASVTDALGAVRTFQYQTVAGSLRNTGVSQPGGSGCGPASSGLTYDANGNVAARTDFNGYKTSYSYDLTRNLETQRVEGLNSDGSARPEIRTISTQWHSVWRLPIKVAEPKKLTTYIYNGDGGATCAPAGATVPMGSGSVPIGVLCSMTEQATTDTTGSAGLSPTVTGTPRTWSYTYDTYGQVLTANGPRTDVSDITTYTYYPITDPDLGKRGNLAAVTNALGHVTQITAYDPNGRPLTVIDPNGATLTFTYTPRGWLKTSSIAGQTTTYDYDNVGQITAVTRPDGSKTTYAYDAAHRLTAVADLKGNSVNFTLDALGNVTHTAWVNPDNSTAKSRSAGFDALGRLQAAIDTRDAVNHTTSYGYDANGNHKTTTDPKGKTTSTSYDALNRPTQITDALAGLVTLAYDARGQITQFKAPNNAQTNFTVDGLGNVTNEASADRGSLTATFDAAGNLLTLSDARGIVERRTYDALNRPLTVSYPTTGENLAYTWDSFAGCANGIGRLCRIADNGGSTTFSYDARGNVTAETRTEGGITLQSTQYTWNGADHLAVEITPSGKLLTTQRDSDGRIQQLSTSVGTNPQVNLVANVTQDAAGNLKTQSFGNGVTENRTYASDGLAVSATVTAPAGGGGGIGDSGGDGDVPTLPEWGAILLGTLLLTLSLRRQGPHRAGGLAGLFAVLLLLPVLASHPARADEALTYDANGNIETRTLSGGTTTFGYDDLNRLNSEAGPAKTQALTYDPNDNRLSDGTGVKTYTANTDRIVTENGQSFTLDAAGNVTQARGLTFVWNQAAAQIRTVSQGGTLLATYFYDYKGRRSRKVTTSAAPQGAGSVIYVYDLYDRLKGEFDGAGNPLKTYVWRDDVPVSIIMHGNPETALYLETDHLNTPIAARDQRGKVVWKWESDAFGTTLPNEDPDGDTQKVTINLRFPGMYADRESGLHYNWHRYYDPRLGRYLSPDPVGLGGGPNLYVYVNNRPTMFTDPEGLMGSRGNPNGPGAGMNPPYRPATNYCVTAECAAGVLPAPFGLRTQKDIDLGQCKLVCQMVTTPPIAVCNAALGGNLLTGLAVGGPLKAGFCSLVCN